MGNPLVGIVMGSDSDLEVMKEAGETLESFGIAYEMTIASAHRSPRRAESYAKISLPGREERRIWPVSWRPGPSCP